MFSAVLSLRLAFSAEICFQSNTWLRYLSDIFPPPPTKHLQNEPTDTSSESWANNSKHFFQSSYQTILTLSDSYYQTVNTLLRVHSKQYTDTFSELLPSNSKHFFQSSYQTILTLLESYYQNNCKHFFLNSYQIILTLSESYC